MQNKNEINSLSDSEILRVWLKTVPYGEYNAVKEMIVDECLIKRTTFHNWLYGKCRIPLSGKRDINRVTMKVSGIEIYTIAKPREAAVDACDGLSGEAI